MSAHPGKNIFTAEEIYDPNFAAFYSTIVKIIFAISISLTILLTYIITTKTPPFMSNLKTYLIPYCIYSLIVELVWVLYTPIILHPFVYFYPTGVAKFLHPKISLVIVVFGAASAISLLDCCIGILLERTVVLRNIEKLKNEFSTIFIPYLNITVKVKIPFLTFILLSLSCLGCFITANVVIFVQPFYVYFLVSYTESVNLHITGLEKFINLDILIIFQGLNENNTFPSFVIFSAIFASFRSITILILIPYNTYKSYCLKSIMSSETKNSNMMLLRMCYLQFTGFFIFLFCPLLIITFAFLFIQIPTKYVYYCFLVMNCFSIYDTVITILCIKPYRTFIVTFIKLQFLPQKQITVVGQSGPL